MGLYVFPLLRGAHRFTETRIGGYGREARLVKSRGDEAEMGLVRTVPARGLEAKELGTQIQNDAKESGTFRNT